MEYDNTNRGALYKNDKQGNEKRPDFTGKINVNGQDFDLSGWMKVSKSGNKYMSLSVREPFKKAAKPAAPAAEPFEDDGIPF